ncbi:DUF3054 domain-containing protein [Flexivirga sp. ID2601S]|uniref:DUF3054 domain-containing protein n=1 Tax=Flexivirga aerilata TaxID=1656889 RepID=A0A849ALL4_9MICO|nr:DUF3054 domain-containing protein [Flexivirga aerilata]NNG41003.1 DUF3054 domain-containing protein [Flexivirga aerilata]
MRRVLPAAVLDVVVILVFAAIGRASHHESNPVVDALGTAWPFLIGAALGWAVSFAVWREAPLRVRHALPVWVCAVAGGMLLRHLTDRGVAFSFVVVATIFLGVFLLGWRAVASLSQRKASA